MAGDTREQFLDTAEALFAERGFYGVSIAAIADELGLTKQALLHHFGSKEKLYGAVLQRISDAYDRKHDDATGSSADPVENLKSYLLSLAAEAPQETARTQLLMRELLDNRRRAEQAGTWYLKPFLESLIGMVRAVPGWETASEARALALAYQLLGAINYFAVSQPTLTGIFGKKAYAALDAEFEGQLAALIEAALREQAIG